MANPYFDDYDRPARNTLIRASAFIAIIDAIIAGFDLVPSPTNLSDYCTCIGPANVYALTSVGTVTSYTAGLRVAFIASAANTGSSTINVNSIGAAALKRQDLTDLHAGDIPSGAMVIAMHDGTRFQLVSMAVADVAAAAASASSASSSASSASASAIAAAASAAAAAVSAAAAGIATIADGTVGAPGLRFASDTDNGFYRIGADNWAAALGGAKLVEFKSGMVGIGMTPSFIFDVTHTQNAGSLIRLTNANSGASSNAAVSLISDSHGMFLQCFSTGFTTSNDLVQDSALLSCNGAGGMGISTHHASGKIKFYTNTTLRAQLDESGYLKASNSGTFLGPSTAYHELVGAGANLQALRVANTHASTPNGMSITFTAGAPNDTTQFFFQGNDTGANRIFIYSNGNVANTNNSYGAISSRALKQDILTAPDHWETTKVLAANLVTYRLKSDVAEKGDAAPVLLGGVAEDWEGFAPELVSTDETTGLKMINYMGALMRGLAAQGKMMERIEALEARLAAK